MLAGELKEPTGSHSPHKAGALEDPWGAAGIRSRGWLKKPGCDGSRDDSIRNRSGVSALTFKKQRQTGKQHGSLLGPLYIWATARR